MSYVLNALIAKEERLAGPATRLRHARPVPLAQGLALIPLTEALWDEVATRQPAEGPDPYPEFYFLSAAVAGWAQEISRTTRVAHVEVELWGGEGTKAAIVWEGGRVVVGPVKIVEGEFTSALSLRKNPINQALRALGARRGLLMDEFDAVGLGRHRATED